MFEEAERRRRGPDSSGRCPEVTLHLSALEIYNESVLDLLAPPPDPRTLHPPPPEDLPIYENEEGGIVVPGLVLAPVTCLDDALHCLFAADMARAVGEHDLNADSTRSHCIYTLHLTGRRGGGAGVARRIGACGGNAPSGFVRSLMCAM